MYVRIKVVKTNVASLETETNRALKELEADNKLVLDTQILKPHSTGELILSVIKYVDDEEKVALTGSIYEEEDDYCEIKNSYGRKW